MEIVSALLSVEAIKIIGCIMVSAGICWLIHDSMREYHYNAGVLAVIESLEQLSHDSEDAEARARLDALYRKALTPELIRLRIIANLVSACVVGWCVGGYFVSLL